jgi:UDP-2,3-diacylglucosamine hydrolase
MTRLDPIQLEVGSLVIADLHLAVEDASSVGSFARWLETLEGVSRLLILGDLFDYWVGMSQARYAGTEEALAALARCVARGTGIDVLLGNRDFLLDAGFERRTGCRVHTEAILGQTPDATRVLFLHGDELCTLDRRYQLLRRVLRSWPVRFVAPRLPGLANLAARYLRRVSEKDLERKPAEEVRQQRAAAEAFALRWGADLLVCGHAHRHRDEPLGKARWIVLDAFGGPAGVLEVLPGGTLGVSKRGPEPGDG